MRFAFLLAVLIISMPAWAVEHPPRGLYQQWRKDTVACRGGAGSEAATNAACEHRNGVDHKMAAAGWCYGRPNEVGVDADWHRYGH